MTGKEPRLKIWFNKYLEPNYLDKRVLDIYYNAYVYNLKTLSYYYKCLFISAKDIDYDVPRERWDGVSDPFLKNHRGADEEFMMDLLANGTYWAITLYKTAHGYKIGDGKHRLLAVKTLMDRSLWPDSRKLLAVTNERIAKAISFSNRVFYVPIALEGGYKKVAKNVYSNLIGEKDKTAAIRDNFVVKPVTEQEIRTPHAAHQHAAIFSGILRDVFFEYRIKTKSIYPPHKAINSETEWANWKPEDFTNLLREFRWLTPS